MTHRFAEIMFTPAVKAVQERMGSRGSYERFEEPDAPARDRFGDGERAFIAARDTLYMATVNEHGWPYAQHRGGPPGFLKVLDDRTLGFADYSGNRQSVSVGNLLIDERVSLFLIDYPNKRRLKVLGRARIIDVRREPDVIERLRDPGYDARIERGMVIRLEAFDWNCPQHITPRFTQEEVKQAIAPLLGRLKQAEAAQSGSGTVAGEASILGTGPLELVVSGIRQLTPRVRSYELRAADGGELPLAAAGSHLTVPVNVDDGTAAVRTYSISSDPALRDRYDIAVLHEPAGRGGSRAVHRDYALGARLRTRAPRNAFSLHDDDRPTILIAGGIGITPVKAMASALRREGRAYRLHFAARSVREAAFLDDLRAEHGDRLSLYATPGTRLDVRRVLDDAPADAIVYVCGPEQLISAVCAAATARGWPAERVRFERFGATAAPEGGEPFDIVLARSGARIHVAADGSALDALQSEGAAVSSNCRTGTCGTCVVKLVSGTPDHRDTVLTDEEHAGGAFATCVSRSRGGDLVIDL